MQSSQPPNEPPADEVARPKPVLPPEHTVQFMENVVVKPSRIAGCVEVVNRINDAPRAVLRLPEP